MKLARSGNRWFKSHENYCRMRRGIFDCGEGAEAEYSGKVSLRSLSTMQTVEPPVQRRGAQLRFTARKTLLRSRFTYGS